MKSYLPTLIFCISIFWLTSCSKDEVHNNNLVLGTYTLTTLKVETAVDLDNDGILEKSLEPGCLSASRLRLDSQSSGSLLFTSDVAYNTISEDGKLEFATICAFNQDLDETPFEYNLNENRLTIVYKGNSYTAIKTGNTISMTVPNGFSATDVETLETTVLQDLTYVFEKN